MTMRSNFAVIVFTPPMVVVGIYAIVRGYWWAMDGPVDVNGIFYGALGLSIVFGLFLSAVGQKEITWDERRCTIRGRLAQSGSYDWSQLEAWSPHESNGVFLIKFQGDMTYQIWRIVFPTKEWKSFRGFLEQNHSESKRLVWINLKPVR
jgi:hypothetical protein